MELTPETIIRTAPSPRVWRPACSGPSQQWLQGRSSVVWRCRSPHLRTARTAVTVNADLTDLGWGMGGIPASTACVPRCHHSYWRPGGLQHGRQALPWLHHGDAIMRLFLSIAFKTQRRVQHCVPCHTDIRTPATPELPVASSRQPSPAHQVCSATGCRAGSNKVS